MDTKLTPEATQKYQSHNDGNLGRALCRCIFCRYVRHIRYSFFYSCPFKVCPSCRPDLDWSRYKAPRAKLPQDKSGAPKGWQFNTLQGLTDEERQHWEDLDEKDKNLKGA